MHTFRVNTDHTQTENLLIAMFYRLYDNIVPCLKKVCMSIKCVCVCVCSEAKLIVLDVTLYYSTT